VHPTLKLPIDELCAQFMASARADRATIAYSPPVALLPAIKTSPWPLGSKTFVMGILNVTPDSFSDGADLATAQLAVDKALEMERNGVDILDVGGESSRPGAAEVTLEEELARVLPVIRGIREKSGIAISIDTTKAEVARQAIAAGANIVNDISAGVKDPEMLATVAALRVPVRV
jgi:dihydropteroate synthase